MGISYNENYVIKSTKFTTFESIKSAYFEQIRDNERTKMLNITRVGVLYENRFFYRVEESTPMLNQPYYFQSSPGLYCGTYITKEELNTLYTFLSTLKEKSIKQVKIFLKRRNFLSINNNTQDPLVSVTDIAGNHQYIFPLDESFIDKLKKYVYEKPIINDVLHFKFVVQ